MDGLQLDGSVLLSSYHGCYLIPLTAAHNYRFTGPYRAFTISSNYRLPLQASSASELRVCAFE